MSKFEDYSDLIESIKQEGQLNATKGTVSYADGKLIIKKGVIYMPPFSGKTTIYEMMPSSVEILDTDFFRYYYKSLPPCYKDIDWLRYYQFVLTNRHELRDDVAIRPTRELLASFIKTTERNDKHLTKFQDDILLHSNSYEYSKILYANENGICFLATPLTKKTLTSKRV